MEKDDLQQAQVVEHYYIQFRKEKKAEQGFFYSIIHFHSSVVKLYTLDQKKIGFGDYTPNNEFDLVNTHTHI